MDRRSRGVDTALEGHEAEDREVDEIRKRLTQVPTGERYEPTGVEVRATCSHRGTREAKPESERALVVALDEVGQ